MEKIDKNNKTITIAISVIVLVVGFFLGLLYQKSKTPQLNNSNQSQIFNRGDRQGVAQGQGLGQGLNQVEDGGKNRGQTPGFRQDLGEIVSLDDSSMTMKMADGSSKIIFFSESTTINQSVSASRDDLQIGSSVAVRANQSNNTFIAENIEINPHLAQIQDN